MLSYNTCSFCNREYILTKNSDPNLCYECAKPMTERNYTCAFCEKWPFKSLAALMNHERDCKVRKSENRAERSISSLPRSDTSTTLVPAVLKDSSAEKSQLPWWKTDESKKKLFKNGNGGSYSYGNQRLCSHYGWVNVSRGYKVLALSSDNKQKLMASKDAEYFVALAETYLSPGEILTNFDSRLNTSPEGLKIIRVIWPDMGTISADDYNRLVDYLVNLLKAGKKVAVGCLGAHGRTGTILAGIILRLEGCTGVQAVQRVRERHCLRAVESQAQERLVANKEIDQTIANLRVLAPMNPPVEEQYTTLFNDEDFETIVVDSRGNLIDDLWEN